MTKIREGYKETEIGVIPEDWEVVELSKIGDVKGGKRIPKGYDLEDKNTGFPYIRVADMYQGGINTSNIKYVPIEVEPDIKKYKISKNDIFVSVAGTLGIIGSVPDELHNANLTENADKICNIKCNKDYLLYYLQAPYIQNVISTEKTIGAQPKLALTRIQKFLIVLPKSQEQQRIAEILSTTDEHIEMLDKTIEDYQFLKKGMMNKILTEGIGHTEFKDTEIGRMPKEWEVKTLGEISEYRRGSFPQPYGNQEWYDDENGYPFVQVYDVDDNFKLKTTTRRKISKVATEMSVFAEKGTILVTLQGSIGKTAMVQYDTYVDRTLLLFTKFKVDFDSRYFMYVIDALFNIEKNKADGGVIKTITKETLTKFLIPIPLIDEQKIIAEALESLSTTLSLLLQEKQDFIQLKKALMEKLLTGKIRTI